MEICTSALIHYLPLFRKTHLFGEIVQIKRSTHIVVSSCRFFAWHIVIVLKWLRFLPIRSGRRNGKNARIKNMGSIVIIRASMYAYGVLFDCYCLILCFLRLILSFWETELRICHFWGRSETKKRRNLSKSPFSSFSPSTPYLLIKT